MLDKILVTPYVSRVCDGAETGGVLVLFIAIAGYSEGKTQDRGVSEEIVMVSVRQSGPDLEFSER